MTDQEALELLRLLNSYFLHYDERPEKMTAKELMEDLKESTRTQDNGIQMID